MSLLGFTFDLWTVWGLVAQGLFFSSFVVQWYKSEQAQKSHLPREFWYLRLAGSLMLIVYVFQRRDLVFLTSVILQIMIYLRNIRLLQRHEN